MVDGELTRTLKRYLKVIFDIESEKGIVRVKDISDRLSISMSSVSSSLRKLHELGYISYEKRTFVKFTVKGRVVADKLDYNSKVLFRFLVDVLKVDRDIAVKQSDIICVDIFDEVLRSIERFMSKL
ncbi:MAG: metal-dependent transcriptional regulator [Brevinematia bacterium]|jgi:DtxR family Mn-dependent transcriptional regulator